jgi:hypothetical protein
LTIEQRASRHSRKAVEPKTSGLAASQNAMRQAPPRAGQEDTMIREFHWSSYAEALLIYSGLHLCIF